MLITHDDLRQGTVEPGELSHNIKQFVPVEYATSGVFAFCAFSSDMPWWANLFTAAPFLYNSRRYAAKDHKLYFITKQEYKPHFKRMEF